MKIGNAFLFLKEKNKMLKNKAYKFRIYPNQKQIELIEKTFGCTRFVFNYFLEQSISSYKEEKKKNTFTQLAKSL